ncbi:MAG: hypothetical protein WCO45_12785 [Pseudanabaena sp. ELA607]|jgi:hypothetical protein
MIVINLSDADTVPIRLPWGEETSIKYLGEMFIPVQVHSNLDKAMIACRHDLDTGMMSIVVTDQNRTSLWWHLPSQTSPMTHLR